MRKKRGIRYEYMTAALFLIFLFAMFALNIKEAAANYAAGGSGDDDGSVHGVRSLAADLESVESAIYPFINLNGLYQNVMRRDYMYDADPANDTVKNRSGQLVSSHSSSVGSKKLTESAKRLKRSSDMMAELGIPLIYIQAANKMVMSEKEAMPGVPNATYYRLEKFLEKIDDQGVEYVDTRDWIETSAAEAFYITDHHWTTETCFTIAQKICGYLNDKYDFGIEEELFSRDSYIFTKHKRAFLGAEGRRTGIYYAGLDDFVEIEPVFDTDFDVKISDRESGHFERRGSFGEAILDKSKDAAHYSFEDSAYYKFWGGDYGRVHVINNRKTDGKKILVFKDSYGIPVTALLTCAFSQMDVIDLRYYSDDETIREIIDETSPDAVLYVYGPGYLTRKSMFTI